MDLDKMKDKLDGLKGDDDGDDNVLQNFWKPETDGGTHKVRIFPTEDGDPFKEFDIHYLDHPDHKPFMCPKRNFNEDCALCQVVSELYDKGDDDQARDLSAASRVYSPVVVRGEEEEGVRWWNYSPTVEEQILEIVVDPEYGDVTDKEEGFDLKVKKEMSDQRINGRRIPKTTVNASRFPSPTVSDEDDELDEDRFEEMKEGAVDIRELLIRYDYEDTKEAFNDYMNRVEKESSGEQEKYADEDDEDDKDAGDVVEEKYKDMFE